MNAADPKIRAAIAQVAADWYTAHRAGPLSAADRARFLAWLKASPIHIEEYLGVAALERMLTTTTLGSDQSIDALVAMARGDAADSVVDIAGPSARHAPTPVRPRRRVWWSLAACVSVAGIAALWVLRDSHGLGGIKTYRTAHGEQAVWPLADGSTLHVNTDTGVTVRFSSAERLVDVDHGQIAIEVAHDDRRTLRVHAGTTDAVAVGTNFDVERRADSTQITVINGQVSVSAAAGSTRSLRVSAGQQVTIVAGVMPQAPQATDLRETTAWLERKIVFEQRPLAAVADEFNRYNDLAFSVDDPALRSLTISGAFNAADTDSFAAFLESLDGVRVERLPTGFKVVSSHAKHAFAVRQS